METIRKTVESKYQPKQTNVAWVDLSGETPIEKHFINGRWVPLGGEGGGTKKYSDLEEKPLINGVELDGNKTSSDLGLATSQQGAKADTAVQQVTVGTTTTGAAGTNASVTNNGTDTNPVLDFTIPRGADAVNPFKGYFNSLSDLQSKYPTGETGDFANVYDSTADKTYRYIWDASLSTPAWVQALDSSSQPIEVTPSTATFATGQSVIDTSIVNDFTTGGSTNVASAETVKELNESKIDKVEIVSQETVYTDITNEDGYPKTVVIQTTGAEKELSAPASWNTAKFAVDPTKQYRIKGRSSNAAYLSYCFYDSTDTMIGTSADYPKNSTYTTYNNITPPSNAAFLRVTGGISFDKPKCSEITVVTETKNNQDIIDSVGDVNDLETTEQQTVVGAINEINGRVVDVEDKVDEITEIKVSPNLFDKSQVVDGKIIATWTAVPQNSTFTYGKYSGLVPIQPNKVYCISGDNITQGVNICCYKADGTTGLQALGARSGTNSLSGTSAYLMPNIDGSNNVSSYVNAQFKTPAEAAYVAFNVATNIDCTNTTMLELVGDTYNENFIPSQYQPYDPTPKTFIKQSAIDCDDTPIEDSDKPITSGGVYEALQNVTPGATQPLKILLIGSSHGMNTIAQLPFIASKSGIPVIVGNVYQGSMSMQWMLGGALRSSYNFQFKLWSNGSWSVTQSLPMTNILKLYDWDYISVQRSASDDEVWTTTAEEVDALSSGAKEYLNINYYQSGATAEYLDHNKTLQGIIDFIKTNANNNPTILVNSNFTDSAFYATDKTNTYIIPSIEKMKDNFGIEYYSTAIALRNARGTFLQLLGNYINGTYPETSHNLTYDGQHIDYGIGCYLLSITLLGFILKMKGMGIETLNGYGTREEMNTNWWVPMSGDNIDRYTEPNEYTMACAKACAKAALLSPSQQNDTVKARFRWSVGYNLVNGVTSTNDIPFSTHQDKYETTLTGVTSQTVTVTSQSSRSANPVDITSQVYDSSTGKITINSVEGDIVITVA